MFLPFNTDPLFDWYIHNFGLCIHNIENDIRQIKTI